MKAFLPNAYDLQPKAVLMQFYFALIFIKSLNKKIG
jgi:hypothetical protein